MAAGTIMEDIIGTDIITIAAIDTIMGTTITMDIDTTMGDGTGLLTDDMDITAIEVPTKDPMPIEIPIDISKQETITGQTVTTDREITTGQTVITDQEIITVQAIMQQGAEVIA